MRFITCKTSCSLILVAVLLAHLAYWLIPVIYRTADAKPAVNFVSIDPNLSTSGQPTVAQIESLAQQGYRVIINLAPADAYGAIPDEAYYVTRNGLTYLNIPVDWKKPDKQDFYRFSSFLQQARTQKVYVHCQANYRASVFVFLYRAYHENINPEQAFSAVEKIWQPNETWDAFIREILREKNISLN